MPDENKPPPIHPDEMTPGDPNQVRPNPPSVVQTAPGQPQQGSTFVFGPATYHLEGNEILLHLSDAAVQTLNNLLNATGNSPDELFRKALGLYKAAFEARRDSKAVGAAPTADVLETEFVGF